MNKAVGWILTIVSVLLVVSIAGSAVLLGRLASMSKEVGKLSTQVSVAQQGESTILSKIASANSAPLQQPNSTGTGNGSNSTDGNTANSANPANSTNSTGTGNSVVGNSFTSSQAEKIAAQIPGIQLAAQSDKNFTAIPQGSQTTPSGYIYITIEYADKMPSHVSALYWIDVRADGLVRDHMSQGNWVQPSQLTLSN